MGGRGNIFIGVPMSGLGRQASKGVRLDDESAWHTGSAGPIRAFVKGFAFLDDTLLAGKELASHFASLPGQNGGPEKGPNSLEASIPSAFDRLNGRFAAVITGPFGLVAVVDRLRSMPLFYGTDGGMFYLSDDAYWVKDQCGGTEDRYAEDVFHEFLATGYVTGPETLCEGLCQVQAAEWIMVKARADGPEGVVRGRYYLFLHDQPSAASEAELAALLDGTLLRVFRRLTGSAGGRTICVPLSGGFDSRLVAGMLKKLGYDKVVCYSYGVAGNREAEISRRVAAKLGYPWTFIGYTNDRWYEWFHSEEMKRYYRFADGLCSLPSVQDWPAVWELCRSGAVDDEAIFVPGHTGDFISGGHIPERLATSSGPGLSGVVDALMGRHYCLADRTRLREAHRKAFAARIMSRLPGLGADTPDDAAGLFECWEWQERQSKFIVNSCRIYEFWGHDWRIPLWDHELMDLFGRVPLSFRLRKKLYDRYLVDHLFRELDINTEGEPSLSPGAPEGSVRSRARQALALGPLKALKYPYAREKEYTTHPLAWYGIMPRKTFRELHFPGAGFNSFRVMERLGLVSLS